MLRQSHPSKLVDWQTAPKPLANAIRLPAQAPASRSVRICPGADVMRNQSVFDRRRFLQSSFALTTGAILAATARAAPAPVEVGSEVQLLLDDWIIAEKKGLRRVLHQPRKRGLIQEADGRDWERGSIYHGNIVCRDGRGRFHMTYRYYWWDPAVRTLHPSIGEDRAHWFRELTGYATSEDGIRWHRPKLGLAEAPAGFKKVAEFPFEVPRRMSKENNLGCPIDFIYDLHAHGNVREPGKRFLLRVTRKDDTHAFAK